MPQVYPRGLGIPVPSSRRRYLICFGLQMNYLRQAPYLPPRHLRTRPRHSPLIRCPHPFHPDHNVFLPFSGHKSRQHMMTMHRLWRQACSLVHRRYLRLRRALWPGRSALHISLTPAPHFKTGYGKLFAKSISRAISERPILQHHPLVSEINDSMWSLHNYRENTFQLPFVSPDAGTMSENDIAELIRHGDWESIREAGVDVFNTEYAMINSESRLRRSLSGSTVEPTSKF